MKLTIEVSEQQGRRLKEIADRLDVSVEALAQAAIRDLTAQPADDFEVVARRILEKNRELYERLS